MQVFVIIYALHNIVGLWPALAGLTTTVLLVPLNTINGRIVHRLRKELIAKTDARIKIMTEIINGNPFPSHPRLYMYMLPPCLHSAFNQHFVANSDVMCE